MLNKAPYVEGSGSMRDKLLNSVQNDKLKNAINEIYRPGGSTGDGGFADAVRHELSTGELVGGKSHIQKALERVTNLENIIKKQPLNSSDLDIANKLLNDLKDALGGNYLKNEELNKKLTEYFPKLQKKYDDEVSWQEGDSTGSHVVFGDVLTPYLVECIVQDNKPEISSIFNFLEDLLCLNDEYVEEVISLSVIESIAYLFTERTYLVELLGKHLEQILKEIS